MRHISYLTKNMLFQVDRKSPEFSSKHGNVETLIEVCFTSLDMLLHQKGILDVMQFANQLQEKVASLQPTTPRNRTASTRPALDRLLSAIPEEGAAPAVKPSGMTFLKILITIN